MKRTFHLGRIAYTGRKKVNPVDVTVELERKGGMGIFTIDRKTGEKTFTGQTPRYYELSICGNVWNGNHRHILAGGQCLDTIAQYRAELNDPAFFNELYTLWKKYHLNGMHAGTPEQEAAVEEWKAAGNRYDYTAACEMLRARACTRSIIPGFLWAAGTRTNRIDTARLGSFRNCPTKSFPGSATCSIRVTSPHKDEDFSPASDADFLSLFSAEKEESHG